MASFQYDPADPAYAPFRLATAGQAGFRSSLTDVSMRFRGLHGSLGPSNHTPSLMHGRASEPVYT